MQKIKIGIPRAFLYYKYKRLWETFFEELKCEIVLSPETNKEILKIGIESSIDESCLSSKVYMGHVHYLIGKADYILIPRIVNFGIGEEVCVKFNAMRDIVSNTFKDAKILDYNVDGKKRKTEIKAFFKVGKTLGKKHSDVLKAYKKAKKAELKDNLDKYLKQEQLLNSSDLKVLVVSHPYNIYDKLIGNPIIKYLKKLGVTPIYPHINMRKK